MAGYAMRQAFLVTCLLCGLTACGGAPKPAQTFIVFFPDSSAQLDAPAKAMIEVAASWARSHPDSPVEVAGYADPQGSTRAAIEASRMRAQVVFEQLITDGVPASRIGRSARGPTDYTLSSQENQQVEIRVGAG